MKVLDKPTSADIPAKAPERVVRERKGPWRIVRLDCFPAEAAIEAVRAHEEALRGKGGEAIKVSPQTCVTAVEAGGRRVCVKQFRSRGFLHGMKDYFRASPARRSWNAARLLRASGIGAPVSLALLVGSFWSVRSDAFLVMEYIGEATAANVFAKERLASFPSGRRRRFLDQAARFLRRLHASRLYHSDLKACNVFVREQDSGFEFLLVDCAAVRRRGRPSARRRLHNLAQLHASLDKSLTWTDRLRFFRAYWAEDNRVGDERAALAKIADFTARRTNVWET